MKLKKQFKAKEKEKKAAATAVVESPPLVEPEGVVPPPDDEDDIDLSAMPGGLADDDEVAAAQQDLGITPPAPKKRGKFTPSGNKVARKQKDHAHRGNLVVTKVGESEILGLVVNDEGDQCIVVPVNDHATLPPMKLAKAVVVKAAYTSQKLASAAQSIPESVLGQEIWARMHQRMNAVSDAKTKTEMMGNTLFGDNYSVQFMPLTKPVAVEAIAPSKQ